MAGELKSHLENWQYQKFAYLCGVDVNDGYIVTPRGAKLFTYRDVRGKHHATSNRAGRSSDFLVLLFIYNKPPRSLVYLGGLLLVFR